MQHPLLTEDMGDDPSVNTEYNINNGNGGEHPLYGKHKPTSSSFSTVLYVVSLVVIALLLVILTVLAVKYYQLSRHNDVIPKPVTTFTLLKPKKLGGKNGAAITNLKIGFFSPASSLVDSVSNITAYKERVTSEFQAQFGAQVFFSANSFDKNGILSGTDEQRVQDIHSLSSDSSVHALIANRGGWGCNRIIDQLDYDLIVNSNHHKVIMGYSDLTGCLNAIFFRTGLITFHGPMGVNSFVNTWNSDVTYNLNTMYMQKLLFKNEKVLFENPPNGATVTVLRGGKATGRLVGGNLSVFAGMIGSNHLPPKSKINLAWEQVILFFEDINEDVMRMDRFMTQLETSGILSRVAGFIFGTCNDCKSYAGTQTLQQVIKDHVKNQPAVMGLQIGHDGQQFTLPIGAKVELNADLGTIQMLETALAD